MGLEQRFGRAEAIPTDHALEFFRDYFGTIIATEARSETRQLSTKRVNTPVGSPRSTTKLTPNSWRCVANRPSTAIQGKIHGHPDAVVLHLAHGDAHCSGTCSRWYALVLAAKMTKAFKRRP